MQIRIGEVTLESVEGDITTQPDIEIIVNAANASLSGGGGVDGAIHRAAGPELVAASRALAPIGPGEAVITEAFALPNAWVIHCVGPIYDRDDDVATRLARCYREAMRLAEEKSAASIAFPAISAGVYGYPLDEAAEIAVASVVRAAREALAVRRVRFVLFSAQALDAFDAALAAHAP